MIQTFIFSQDYYIYSTPAIFFDPSSLCNDVAMSGSTSSKMQLRQPQA